LSRPRSITTGIIRSRQLDAAAERRLVDLWRDPEALVGDCRTRFGLLPADIAALTAKLGPKARGGPSSCRAVSQARRAGRRKDLRKRREQDCAWMG